MSDSGDAYPGVHEYVNHLLDTAMSVTVLGVNITDLFMRDAISLLESLITREDHHQTGAKLKRKTGAGT